MSPQPASSGYARRHAIRRRLVAARPQPAARLPDAEYVAEIERRRAWLRDTAEPALADLYRRRGYYGSAMPPEYRDAYRVLKRFLFKLTIGGPFSTIHQDKLAGSVKMCLHTLQRRLDDLAEAELLGRQRYSTGNAYWLPAFGHGPKGRREVPHFVRKKIEPLAENSPELKSLPSVAHSTEAETVPISSGRVQGTAIESPEVGSRLLRMAIENGIAAETARRLTKNLSEEVKKQVSDHIDMAIKAGKIRETLAGYTIWALRNPGKCKPRERPHFEPPAAERPELQEWQAPELGPPPEPPTAAELAERDTFVKQLERKIGEERLRAQGSASDQERRRELRDEMERIKGERLRARLPAFRRASEFSTGDQIAAHFRAAENLGKCLKCKKTAELRAGVCIECREAPEWKM